MNKGTKFRSAVAALAWLAASPGHAAGAKSKPAEAAASPVPSPDPVATPAPSPGPSAAPGAKGRDNEAAIAELCSQLEGLFKKQNWAKADCAQIPFEVFGWSSQGRPLVVFKSGTKGKLSLVQCGIHGDELPSTPMCLSLIREVIDGKRPLRPGTRLAVQPLLNPDGMLGGPKPTRNNARGVDINRNFPTKHWSNEAQPSWKKKDRGDPRKYPGDKANTESETQAIVDFIAKDRPQKIISVHTPLGFLDLDAPSTNADRQRRAKYLAINIAKNAGNYKFRTFGVYPGSLGNYAGRERQIPVYTLELPSGSSRTTVEGYWTKFRVSVWRAIDFDLDTGQFIED